MLILCFQLVNKKHFQRVKHYFGNKRCLNMYLNTCKQCLSRDPCQQIGTYRCGHRIISKMNSWMSLLKLHLVQPHTVFIHCPMQPRSIRSVMHGMRKILGALDSGELLLVFLWFRKLRQSVVDDLRGLGRN